MNAVGYQLEMFGLDGARLQAHAAGSSPKERIRLVRRVETAHEIMSVLPRGRELSFLHSGLCQTCLPHSRPTDNSTPWERRSGRFSLTVLPGGLDRGRGFEYVGIPYGPKARLILIYLQTEGMKSRAVSLGASFSAFLRSLGLAVTGGRRGTISAVREQLLRISQCRFTMQWISTDTTQQVIANTQIVDRLELWRAEGTSGWSMSSYLSSFTSIFVNMRCHSTVEELPTSRAVALGSISTLSLRIVCLVSIAICI